MKHFWLIALIASIATPAAAQQSPQYLYTARTEAPATRQGAVRAGVLTWQCQGSACTITGPWPFPIAAGCAQLAREVGRIVSYGREGRMLGAPGLATCNAGIAAVAPPALRLPPRVVAAGPLITVRPQPSGSQAQPAPTQPQPEPQPQPEQAPPPQPEPSQPQSSLEGPIATPELSFVVGGAAPPPPPPVTITVAVPSLSFVVGGAAPPPPAPVITTVAVPELSFLVR
jgi:hypothetical protein